MTAKTAFVAGGGIGGVAAALALAGAGFETTLFERAPAFEDVGAGIQISPNAVRALDRLGAVEAVAARALAPSALSIRRGGDDRELARMALGAEAARRWGRPYLALTRAGLHEALVETARATGRIAFAMGTSVAGCALDGAGVRVALKRDILRSSEFCDLLVCADGVASELRGKLSGGADGPKPTGHVAFRAMFEAPAALARAPGAEVRLWLAPGGHLVAYRVPGGRTNLVLVANGGQTRGDQAKNDQTKSESPPAALVARFAGDAAQLLAAVPGWRPWPLLARPAPTNWSSGPIALLGDAAHAMPPFLGQGAAQAIEDAAALGQALRADATIAEALARYGAARAPRVARVVREAHAQARVYHAGGLHAFARDLALRSMGGARLAARYDWLYGG